MWNNNIGFEHDEWLLAVVLGGIWLYAVFVWKVWNGKADVRFYLNAIVSFIAVLSLALLVLGPTILREVKGEVVLLTDGYSEYQLDSLKKANGQLVSMEYTPGMDLSSRLDSINHLVVIGHGVKPYDLWQFKDENIEFVPVEVSEGIVQLKYDEKTFVGDEVTVGGVYKSSRGEVRLVLQGPGGTDLDSMVLKGKGVHSFALKANAKVAGKFVYNLQLKDSIEGLLGTEPLPIVVEKKKVLKILTVNEYPSFETKYLKNFLSEKGHKIVVRTKLTKQKYKFEYLNTNREAIYSLNNENLNGFDLVVFDDRSLKNLSRSELSALSTSVINNGLGIFIQQTEKTFQDKNALTDFEMIRDGQTFLQLPNSPKNNLEKYPVHFKGSGLMGVSFDGYGYAVQKGMGRIGSTVLRNTYQLVLDGKYSVYKEIWSKMINGIGKLEASSGSFKKASDFVFANEPYEFSLFTLDENPVLWMNDDFKIPMIKDVVMDDEWKGVVYAKATGWHQLVSEKESAVTSNFYVFQDGNWNSLMKSGTLRSNRRFFNTSKLQYPIKKNPQKINPFWFFVFFLLAMGYVWLEPKLR